MMQSPRGKNERYSLLAHQRRQRRVRQGRVVASPPEQPDTHRWQSLKPWLFVALGLGLLGTALLTASVLALGAGQKVAADALTPVGIMIFAASIAPLMLGFLRFIDPPVTVNQQRCGRCRFYQATDASYAHGWCGAESMRHATVSTGGCVRFQFSERAMVREKLSAAPHVLNSRTEG